MVLVVVIVIIFFLLLACAIKKHSSRRIPSREVLLDQRRRQRALIRRERLRRMGIEPSDTTSILRGNGEQVQLTAEEAEIRRKTLQKMFEHTNVQTVRRDCDVHIAGWLLDKAIFLIL